MTNFRIKKNVTVKRASFYFKTRLWLLSVLLAGASAGPVFAQDQLKPIGQPVQLVKVKEVRAKEVSYVKYTSQSGPTFVVDINTLNWLILQGDKDTIFFQRVTQTEAVSGTVPVIKPTTIEPPAPASSDAKTSAAKPYEQSREEARIMKRVRPVSGSERYDLTIGASFLAGVPITSVGVLRTSAINNGNTDLIDKGGPTGIFRFEIYARLNKSWSVFGGLQFTQQRTDFSNSLGSALAQDPNLQWDANGKAYTVNNFYLGVARPFSVLPNVELIPRLAVSYGTMRTPEYSLSTSATGIPGRSNFITLGGAGSRIAIGAFIGGQARVYLQRKNYLTVEAMADASYATFTYSESSYSSGSQTSTSQNQSFAALVNGWYWGLGYHLGF